MFKQLFKQLFKLFILLFMNAYRFNNKKESDQSIIILTILIVLAFIWPYREKLKSYLSDIKLFIVALLIISVVLISILIVRKKRSSRSFDYGLKPQLWDQMTGVEFEDQIIIWLKIIGYKKISKTEYFDLGVDIIAAKPGELLGVQVKKSNKPIGVSAVRAVVAGLKSYNCNRAMVVTNSIFTIPAIQLAKINNTRLVSGNELRSHLKIKN